MEHDSKHKHRIQWLGLFLGPVLAILALLLLPESYESQTSDAASVNQPLAATDGQEELPEAEQPVKTFSWAGRATLAVMVWMGTWWLTEAIEISATALLPLVLFPLMGVADMKSAAAPYAHYLIFLYMGGFILALSMERWGLGRRIALITLKVIGSGAPQMIVGFMLVTAFLSAFVSNTATTAMMLPIALSTIALLQTQESCSESVGRFATCLLLAIAYSASVGGVLTIIGTPPNAFLVGFLRETIQPEYRTHFSFAGWLPIGGSVVLVMLPIVYFMLTKVLYPIKGVELEGGREMIKSKLHDLGAVNRGEWNTLIVFLLAVTGWLTRPWLIRWELSWFGTELRPLAGLTDTGIAMLAAMILFLLPVNVRKREFTVSWDIVNKLPWGILILFGGGLSLAAAVQANGVAEFLGSYAGRIGTLPTVLVVLLVTGAIVFLTELTSNLATTTSLVPVLAAIAPSVGIHPYVLILPATVAASCAFMLPVATPPNAIVFGSGKIALAEMIKAGIVLNLVSLVVVTLLTLLVFRPWLGV